MKVLILGADGYLGWPTAIHFTSRDHEVLAVDNYYRRVIADKTDSSPIDVNPMLRALRNLYECRQKAD